MCYNTIRGAKIEAKIKELFKKKGIPRNQIEAIEVELADRPVKPSENYYYYDGPLDEKTRDFCRYMLAVDKVVSETDIIVLSDNLGYDVLQYKGSYNCRHRWIKFKGKRISTPALTNNQIDRLIDKGIKA